MKKWRNRIERANKQRHFLLIIIRGEILKAWNCILIGLKFIKAPLRTFNLISRNCEKHRRGIPQFLEKLIILSNSVSATTWELKYFPKYHINLCLKLQQNYSRVILNIWCLSQNFTDSPKQLRRLYIKKKNFLLHPVIESN